MGGGVSIDLDFRIGPDQTDFMTNLTTPQAVIPAAKSRLWALVPCAGTGSRAGSASPKQYLSVAGQAMVLHTLAAFTATPDIENIVVVVAPGDSFFDDLDLNLNLRNVAIKVASCGGSTRAESVLNGLNAVLALGGLPSDWVLVHDAARCLITPTQITALIDTCEGDEVGGLLALPLPDTLKSGADGRVASTLERADKWLAQTPQMFRIGALQEALRRAGTAVTDESSAMEAMGLSPKLVPGSAQNFKVTYPEDFALAEAVILSRRRASAELIATTENNYDYP
jgi:2-C-methyl-D-erythritol 4-phosphate cytidylyltransferase